ncbi:MAG: hypothetical protein H0T65_22940, partial [Deltaproteobacteria bacterium]|nr:hypothetical protein [Deltaproteobacteria bacterium]
DHGAAWLAKHGAPIALGLLTIAMVVLYSDTFRGETVGDDLTFHMAESARLADCIRVGDWDFWNPSANGGFASLYYYQAIPQLASAIPTAAFGHHLFWFQLSVVLPHILAPAAAYRGMRLMGASPWQSFVAAGVIAFMNGESRWGAGNAGTFQVGLYTQSWALAALPLALGHTVRWVMDQRGLAPAIAWGTFVWLCHPFAGISLGIILIAAFAALLVMPGVDYVLRQLGRAIAPNPNDGMLEAALAHHAARWENPPARGIGPELVRSFILGVALLVAWMPVYLPLLVDYDGFGGFPHRVNDEVGPGFKALAQWHASGKLLDHGHYAPLLTYALPIVLVFARARYMRWLWAPAFVFAFLLGIGPHIGKTSGDDLFPAVRFLGSMQVLFALAVGAGALVIGRSLWNARRDSLLYWVLRVVLAAAIIFIHAAILFQFMIGDPDSAVMQLAQRVTFSAFEPSAVRWIGIGLVVLFVIAYVPTWRALATQYGVRTGLAAVAAAMTVMLVQPGWQSLDARLYVLDDYPSENPGQQKKQIYGVIDVLRKQPHGRKQVGPGVENHWWNLLSYCYARVPALLQMGGGGLQASPNYDFVWSVRDFKKTAWVYDAPYLVFPNNKASEMPAGETITKTETHEVRRLPAPGLVSPVQITGLLPYGPARADTEVRKKAIEWLKSDDAYADKVLAYPEYFPDDVRPSAPSPAPVAIVLRAFRQDSPGDAADIIAEVDVSSTSMFMARESWHPRWHAYIDGKETHVLRVTPDFPAIEVPPGKHVLSFRFERPW